MKKILSIKFAMKLGGKFILDYYSKYKQEENYIKKIHINKEEQFIEIDIDEMWLPF